MDTNDWDGVPAKGDRAAMERFAGWLRGYLHRTRSRWYRNDLKTPAEDILQDVLFSALRKVVGIRRSDGPTLRAWVLRVARNRALDVVRCEASRTAPDEEIAPRARRLRLRPHLDATRLFQRGTGALMSDEEVAWRMVDYLGSSVDVVCLVLGRRVEKTTRNVVLRARARIRTELDGRADRLGPLELLLPGTDTYLGAT